MLANHPFRARFIGASLSILLVAGCSKIKQMEASGDGAAGAASASGASLEGFEGEITVDIKSVANQTPQHPPTQLVLLVNGSKLRTDLPAEAVESLKLGKAYAVFDVPQKKIFAVLDDRKEVVALESDKMADQLKNMAPKNPSAAAPSAAKEPPPKIVKTNHKDTVAGYACQDWDIISQDGSKATVCFTDQDSGLSKFFLSAIPADYTWMAELLDGKHFPLRAISFDKAGVEQEKVEVTKLERKPESPQLFDIPAGYKVVDLEQAIQEFVAEAMVKQGFPGGTPMPGAMPSGMHHGAAPLHSAEHPKPALASGSPKPAAPHPKQK